MFLPLPTAKIFYNIKGSGIPVVMLHGFPQDHTVMEASFEPLFKKIKGFKRIYFDLPTMGRSGATNKIRNTEAVLNAIEEFISLVLKNERFLIIGYSYGGYLARCLAAMMPERMMGIIMIAPVVVADRKKRKVPKPKITSGRNFSPRFSNDIEADLFNTLVARNAKVWDKVKRHIVPSIKRGNKFLQNKIFEPENYSAPANILRKKKKFLRPVLIITGRNDSTVGYKDAEKLLNRFPNSAHLNLRNVGHNLIFEQQKKVLTIIAEWLETMPRREQYGMR